MVGNVFGLDAVEIKNLAPRQNSRQYFVFFGSGQYKDSVGGRFFECFEKSIESSLRQHVHLVDDVDLVLARLWRVTHLVDQVSDVFDRVVRCRVEFVDVEGGVVLKTHARLAPPARLRVCAKILTVNGFGQNTGARCFAHAARPTKQKGLRQVVGSDGVFERNRYVRLPNHRIEGDGAILAGRNDEIFHGAS